jgi:iron(II)-dependent oxidoreductase
VEATLQRPQERLAAVRERTLELVASIDEDVLGCRPDAIMSPLAWDVGHIAAYEELWIARRIGGHESLHPELEELYDAAETPRPLRAALPFLRGPDCLAYLEAVRERTIEVLEDPRVDRSSELLRGDFVVGLVAEHEAQHTETMLQALQMLPEGSYRPERHAAPLAARDGGGRVSVRGGAFSMGASAEGFAYDCERPRHEREVDAFVIDRSPATNARHLEFMADGGYERPELWSADGWRWRTETGARAPLYWARDGTDWIARSFDRWAAVDPDLPVCHVSWYEAEAHARWAGGRLPTEAEWERAAAWDPVAGQSRARPWGDADPEGRANLDQRGFAPAPVGAYPDGAADCGALGMAGDVWEWTSTAFRGYPGFRPFPYPEYAEVFFGDRYRVLRGASWATRACVARCTFRNWDLPERRQIFAGFRVAWPA